jgi:1-acyl-sn-glycerol-3-phosphate acyltransferase
MNLLRAAWYVWTVFWVSLVNSLTVIIASLLGIKYRKGGVYDLAARRWGTWLATSNGLRVKVEGLDHIVAGHPYVFISNHFSFADMWVLLAALPDSVRFVAKKELFDIPIFGRALRSARHIRIDRRNLQAAFGAYEEAGVAIREGMSAIVFAEGTRSRDGKLQPFKKGPFVLGIAAQVEVVPVWVDGTFEALPSWRWWVKPGVATVRLGVPVPTAGMDYERRDALMEQVRAQIIGLAGDSNAVRVDPAGGWE